MNHRETPPERRQMPAVWRIIAIGILIIVAIAAAIILNHPKFQEIIGNPGVIFAGDDVLEEASRDLINAEKALKRNPDNESAHLRRARAYLVFGHLEGVRKEWETWSGKGGPGWGEVGRRLEELELKLDEIRALLHDAETSPMPSEKYPPIYILLDDISERYSGLVKYRALFLKGYLLLREGRKAEAEPIFGEELVHYKPLGDYVAYNHARSVSVTGRETEALDLFSDFITGYPASRLAPLAYLERINILKDMELYQQAVSECDRALDSYPANEFAAKMLRKKAEIFEAQLDFDNGGLIRADVVRKYPDSEEADDTLEMFFDGLYSVDLLSDADRLPVAYGAIGKYTSDAIDYLRKLSESGNLSAKQRAQASHGVGRCEYIRGRWYDCIEWEEKARDIGPGTEWADRAGIRIGHAYNRLNKTESAHASFRKVAEGKGPLASQAAEILWMSAYSVMDLATVEEMCRFIVEEYPSSAECPAAMTMLAYQGCRNRQYRSALGYAEKCLKAFPDNPSSAEAGFWYAFALDSLGRDVEAGDAYRKLSDRVPWDYWGMRAGEKILRKPEPESVDVYDFDIRNASCFDGNLARAWELYDSGTLELAEAEFRLARENNISGATAGLALVYAEQDLMRESVLTIRTGAAAGDQAGMTPGRQYRLKDKSWPRVYVDEVTNASLAHDVPASWLWGAMRQESCFNPDARSGAGACGLIQVMPQTGRFIADMRGADSFDPEILWEPAVNIDYAAWYLAYLRDEVGGNLADILAAYNGGPGRLKRQKDQLPARDQDIFISAIPSEETRKFVHWVYANIRMYEMILEERDFQLVPF